MWLARQAEPDSGPGPGRQGRTPGTTEGHTAWPVTSLLPQRGEGECSPTTLRNKGAPTGRGGETGHGDAATTQAEEELELS